MNPIVSTLIKGMLYFILKAKQGGKYLSRKQVIDKRTGRKTWKYKYKPMQQRAAHEVTRNKFEKVTKLSGDEHKNQIERALQNGVRVSLHVLKDYPDLIKKYNQQARMAKAEKIRAKVKAHIAEIKNIPKVDDSVSMENEIIKDIDSSAYKPVETSTIEIDGKVFDIEIRESIDPNLAKNIGGKKLRHYITINGKLGSKDTNTLSHPKNSISEIFMTLGEAKAEAKEYVELAEAYKRYIDIINDPKTLKYHGKKEQFEKKVESIRKEMDKYSEDIQIPKWQKWKNKQLHKPAPDNREVENNFDTMPESKPEPVKSPDLKANFEAWKEERKAPAFKLEQEDITSKEKNTRFNDAQGGLFGKKPVTHESYANKDFKPSLALEGTETITSLVTAVKSALMREGLDTKAREFVDKAFKEKDISSLKKLASEYVDMKESSQVSNPSTENKGSEEKKMETVKWQDVIKLKGSDKQIKYAKDLLALKNNEQYSTKFYILSKLIQKSATTNPDKEFNASEIISLMKDNWSKAHTKKVGELLGHEISNVPPNDNYNPLDDYIATKVLGATWDENRGFYIKDGNTVNVPDWILGSKLEYPDHIAGQKDKENAAIIKEWLKN